MALTSEQKAEKAYKKSVLGVAMTADDKSYYTEPASPLTAKSKNIWIDDDKVPSVAPLTPTVNTVYDENGVATSVSGLLGVIQYVETDMIQIAGAPNSFKMQTIENDAISFIDFNGAYAPVFIDNSTLQTIPVGLNNMEFDAASGTLTFYDGKPSSLNSIKAKYWRYVGRKLTSLKESLEDNVVISAFPIYNGVSTATLVDKTFTLTHNRNTTEFTWKLLEGNKFIEPTSLVIIDENTVEITLDSVPTELDNVVFKFIELDGGVVLNAANHDDLLNIGANSHAQIDAFISATNTSLSNKLEKDISANADIALPLLDTDEFFVSRDGQMYKVSKNALGSSADTIMIPHLYTIALTSADATWWNAGNGASSTKGFVFINSGTSDLITSVDNATIHHFKATRNCKIKSLAIDFINTGGGVYYLGIVKAKRVSGNAFYQSTLIDKVEIYNDVMFGGANTFYQAQQFQTILEGAFSNNTLEADDCVFICMSNTFVQNGSAGSNNLITLEIENI